MFKIVVVGSYLLQRIKTLRTQATEQQPETVTHRLHRDPVDLLPLEGLERLLPAEPIEIGAGVPPQIDAFFLRLTFGNRRNVSVDILQPQKLSSALGVDKLDRKSTRLNSSH